MTDFGVILTPFLTPFSPLLNTGRLSKSSGIQTVKSSLFGSKMDSCKTVKKGSFLDPQFDPFFAYFTKMAILDLFLTWTFRKGMKSCTNLTHFDGPNGHIRNTLSPLLGHGFDPQNPENGRF